MGVVPVLPPWVAGLVAGVASLILVVAHEDDFFLSVTELLQNNVVFSLIYLDTLDFNPVLLSRRRS